MSMTFIAIGAVALGGISYRFFARMASRQSAAYRLDEKRES